MWRIVCLRNNKFSVFRKLKVNMDLLTKSYTKIAIVVTVYWIVSIFMVFINKFLLSSNDLKLDAPLFVTWFQCVISVGLCGLMLLSSRILPAMMLFPTLNFDLRLCRATLPLSVVFVGMITFNNLCLKHVGVPFYYVGRSLTTVFNVVFTYLILGKSTSLKVVICCGVIIGGFFLGVDEESLTGSFSVKGVMFGVLASASVALNAIYTKKVLPLLDDSVWRLTFYNNLNAIFLFLPLMVVSGDVAEMGGFSKQYNVVFWNWLVVSGIFGFAIGFVTGLQIQFTSALTHNISGTAKACTQTVLACLYYSEEKSKLWWLSNIIILAGSWSYSEVRRREMKEQHLLDAKMQAECSGKNVECKECC